MVSFFENDYFLHKLKSKYYSCLCSYNESISARKCLFKLYKDNIDNNVDISLINDDSLLKLIINYNNINSNRKLRSLPFLETIKENHNKDILKDNFIEKENTSIKELEMLNSLKNRKIINLSNYNTERSNVNYNININNDILFKERKKGKREKKKKTDFTQSEVKSSSDIKKNNNWAKQ